MRHLLSHRIKYPGGSKKPPDRQRIFAETVSQTGDLALAHLTAYKRAVNKTLEENYEAGKKLLSRSKVRELLIALWDAQGLTLADAARIHSEVANKSRKGSDKLRAIETIYKVHGALDSEEKVSKDGDTLNFIQLFVKASTDRGLTIPAEIIEVKNQLEGK